MFIASVVSITLETGSSGPIGWCIPYEYNNSDLDACLSENGGKATASMSQRLFSPLARHVVPIVYG